MEALVTGADTGIGRTVVEAFAAAGHQLMVTGGEDVKRLAAELGTAAVVCDAADPVSLAEAQTRFPQHLDTVVVIPAEISDESRSTTLAGTAAAWRTAFDSSVLSVVLTAQAATEHLRPGGSIIVVLPGCDTGPQAAAKAALSEWTAAQADHFGARGVTINVVAAGRPAPPGYDGLHGTPLQAENEIARLALFLSTPAARHITGQTLHVGRGAAVTYR